MGVPCALWQCDPPMSSLNFDAAQQLMYAVVDQAFYSFTPTGDIQSDLRDVRGHLEAVCLG